MTEEEEIFERFESLKSTIAERRLNDFEKGENENPGSELLIKKSSDHGATQMKWLTTGVLAWITIIMTLGYTFWLEDHPKTLPPGVCRLGSLAVVSHPGEQPVMYVCARGSWEAHK